MSVVDDLIAKAEMEKKQEELSKEELDQLKGAVNRLLSSPDGIFFWRKMKKVMRIDLVNKDFNPLIMAGEKAMRNVYLSVMKLLDADVIQQIERGE